MQRIAYIVFLNLLWVAAQAAPIGWLNNNQYDCGEWLEITATPLSGYRFVGWSDGSSDASRKIEVTGDAEYIALFDTEPSPEVALWPNAVNADEWMQLVGLNPDEETSIQIYSAAGHMLGSYTITGEPVHLLQAQGVSGCYTVRVKSQSIKAVLKYIVFAK